MDDEDLILSDLNNGNNLITSDARQSSAAANYNALFESPINLTGQSGLGSSMFDKKEIPFSQLSNINEIRAQRQPWIAKAGAGVARATTKAGIEIAKMVPVITGLIGGTVGQIADLATGEDNTDFLETAFNNSWIKGLDNINEEINTELLPVYVRKAVKDGNLWDNITSIDFWATEGADGIGYMAAMLAPGAIINKFGAGAKIFKGLNKLGAMGSKLDDAVMGLGKLGITPKNADIYSAAFANTLFEAGAEAKGAGDSYVSKMTPKLENGTISQEDFDLGKAQAMQNVFISNMTILAGPNLIMSKMLWGKGANRAIGGLINKEDQVIKELAAKTFKSKAKNALTDLGKGALSEGFFEEGMQSVAETYFTDKAEKGEDSNLFSLLGELIPSYIDMIGTTEGQKAIFLGSVLGGGMTTFSGKVQRAQERGAIEKLLPELSKLDSFYKIFADDIHKEDGTIDNIKFKEKAEAFGISEVLSEAFDKAIDSGDTNTVEALRAYTSGELVKNFIFNDELGIDALKQYFESSKTIEEVAQKDKTDVENITKSVIDRAIKLQDDYNVFKDFAPSLVKLENEASTKEDKIRYYDKLASKYITNKNLKYFYQDQTNKAIDKRKNLLKSLDKDQNLVTEDETLVNLEKDNFALKEINDDVRNFEEILGKLKDNDNNFWKESTHQEEFNKDVKTREILDKASEEAKLKEIESIQDIISKASTEEELDNIKYTNTVADKALKEAVKQKRVEIKDLGIKKTEEQVVSQTTATEKATNEADAVDTTSENEINHITDNYNENDIIDITDELIESTAKLSPENRLTDNDKLDTVILKSINDDSITLSIIGESTRDITIPKTTVKESKSNPELGFSVEGSDNHDILIPKNNENNEKGDEAVRSNGTPILSYDKVKKAKLPFVSDKFIELEQEPTNKKGVTIGFKINTEVKGNKNWDNAIKGYNSLLNGETLTQKQIDFLIEHLPINAILGEESSPIHTVYESNGNTKKFDNSTKLLRTQIINALIAGSSIENITSSIEGQYGGELQVEPNLNNKAIENSVLDLHHLFRVAENKRLETVKKNLGFVNSDGKLEFLDGTKDPYFRTSKGIGELYMLVPKANGDMFPLKLNIQKIQKVEADLLAKLYELRINNDTVDRQTTLLEVEDKAFVEEVKTTFAEQIKLIGKPANDIEIKDIVDFFIWDLSKSTKSQVKFTETKVKGESQFLYGNPKIDGKVISKPEDFNVEEFSQWLQDNKRYNINMKPKKGSTTNATIKTNNNYLSHLLNNKIVNTNAVVGEHTPTFQGYTGLYLNSNDVRVSGKAAEVIKEVDSKPYSLVSDGHNLKPVTFNGKDYIIAEKSGRIFEDIKVGGKRVMSKIKIVTDRDLLHNIIMDNLSEEEIELMNPRMTDETMDEISRDRDLETKGDIERRRQEDLNDRNFTENNTDGKWDVAADYLLTGGINTVISTDYLLLGIAGIFDRATGLIDNIRNKYAKELSDLNQVDIKNFIGTDIYNKIINDIKNILEKTYSNKEEAKKILDEILKHPTGSPNRIGSQISSRIDALNKEQESKINAKYDAELKALENKPEIIRKSQKKAVPLHTIKNTAEATKLEEVKKKTIKTDKVDVTDDLIVNLIGELTQSGVLQIGGEVFSNIMNKDSNNARFQELKTLAEKANLNINDLITKCK